MAVPLTEDVASSIASLPVEILTLIFEAYIDIGPPSQGEFYDYTPALFRDSPIILTQVCCHWREITLATPSLWTFISPSYESIPRVRRWLAICPKYSLDLQLVRGLYHAVSQDYASSVFNLFAKEAYRWRSLSIELDADMAAGLVKILRSDKSIPSTLEKLKVEPSREPELRVPVSTLEALAGLLPSLKFLQHLIWTDKYEASLHSVPWSQLKTVVIDLPSSLENIFSYFSQCTSATTVTIHGETPKHPGKTRLPSHRFPACTLPDLTSVKLSRGCDPMWLLRHFTLPSLQHLEVAILRRDQQALEDFVKRSPNIHTLIVDERYGEDYSYADEVLITDREIVAYLTSPCLRAISRVGLDLLYTKKRIPALIQECLEGGRPLPPLLCWIPENWDQRLVGWWDELDPQLHTLLFSYKDGPIELSSEYEIDSDYPF
ncbi:hypothetical protein NLJ89_g3911 [Agrocybe chaxingu]|uniref:F-box domain-containing protein n=1 Tax=Agrocybe chaxingu TaxID=84603 RepID=A0A9W8MV19_9AGAR|nr:hypothetical protein NLJ89_g3911 [Agrocybe chaxingu]